VRRLLLVLIVIGTVASYAACASFRAAERRFLFPAPPTPPEDPTVGADVQRTWLDIPGGRVEAFLLRPSSPPQGGAPLVIYAHGNGELVDYWLPEFKDLQRQGIGILLVEYPGYGRSTGVPSETSIREALAAAYDWAVSQPEVDPTRVVGYGRSLGGGAICALAGVRTLAALVLESTFTSVRDVAADVFGVPRVPVDDSFDNLRCVAHYRMPVLILHGEADSSIPVAHARRLAATAHDSSLTILQCGHNDCPRPLSTLRTFLATHGLHSS